MEILRCVLAAQCNVGAPGVPLAIHCQTLMSRVSLASIRHWSLELPRHCQILMLGVLLVSYHYQTFLPGAPITGHC